MLIIFYKTTMFKKSTFLELLGFEEFTDPLYIYIYNCRHDVGNVLTFILKYSCYGNLITQAQHIVIIVNRLQLRNII